MTRSLGSLSRAGGRPRPYFDRKLGGKIALIAVPIVIVLMALSSANLAAESAHLSPRSPTTPSVVSPGPSLPHASPKAPSTVLAPADDPVTHGDLIVPSGVTITIVPLSGTQTYYQGGNITVEAGGTLIVRNTTISFVQFILQGEPMDAAISHIYRFIDAGTVEFYNSGITTNTVTLNAIPKLFVNITGNFTAWNSSFEFPGWLVVHGASAVATFNGSTIAANPTIDDLTETQTMYNDSVYAPALNVTGGATFNWFGGTYADPYADNTTASGFPSSQPISTTTYLWLNLSADRDVANSQFSVPSGTTPEELAQDMLYPSQATAITLTADFDNTGTKSVNATVTLEYAGTTYAFGNLTFPVGSGVATNVTTPDAPILAAMYLEGSAFYLSAAVNFTTFSVSNANLHVNVTSLSLTLTPRLDYNLSVSGPGTVLNLVNLELPLTWNVPDPSKPWDSTKLALADGATANFVGLTTSNPISTFGYTSAVSVAPGTTANFYRWAELEFLGGPNPPTIGVYDASVLAAYSYDTTQSNNATANGLLTNLTGKGNPIYAYAQYLAGTNSQLGYNVSGPYGVIPIILPDSQLTSSSAPNGVYLGTFHVSARLPFLKAIQWFYGSVSPYPQGVASNTPSYGTTDVWPSTYYPQYVVTPSIGAIAVTANGTLSASSSARIGQVLGLNVTFTNKGDAPVYSLLGLMAWNNTTKVSAPYGLMTFLNATTVSGLSLWGGESYVAHFTWFINDSNRSLPVDQGSPFLHEFFGALYWIASPIDSYYGVKPFYVNVTIEQSQIRIVSASPAPTPVVLSASYVTTGVVQYNGSRDASIFLYAVPTAASPITLGSTAALPGAFSIVWISPLSNVLSQGTTYTLEVVATYNGVSTTYVIGSLTVPSAPSPVSNFLYEKILGLPLWVWLAIAAAIVVAVAAFLLFARRQAAGKLVECGECGNLIPEDATVCPKCGAEFEHDLIRCSRCASTIPADSKVCPECAAQLLGKPGEADPERQGYADFTERYRAEAKRELGENYSEGAFWDWWKRQPSYTSFSQWKLQQGTGTSRAGMTAPPAASPVEETKTVVSGAPPGAGGAAPSVGAPPPPSPPPAPVTLTGAPAAPPPGAPAGGPLKACPSCGKEIPPEYLVCPFCGAVTQ